MKILIAEDNDTNRDMLSRRLKRRGYDVEIAINGQHAVAANAEVKPDLILMDLSMPIMSGLEATQKIREQESDATHTPIIALTAHAMESDRRRCIEAGCDAFATKPVDFTALIELINQLA